MRKIISQNEILGMEKQPRVNLINSLPGIRGANLIGTIDPKGQTNAAIFNSVMHIGANPPYMGFIARPAVAPKGTYYNISRTGFFTINHVHLSMYQQAHQTSARYEKSEFEAVNFIPEFSPNMPAPYVKESRVKIGLRFVEDQYIQCNKTILIVGEIVEIIMEDDYLNEDFILQLNETESVGVNGLETYYKVAKLEQLPYAKP
jgi:flavin reductase (DIM6/NTAB) family NADH-FMN oxidoreductase RutF